MSIFEYDSRIVLIHDCPRCGDTEACTGWLCTNGCHDEVCNIWQCDDANCIYFNCGSCVEYMRLEYLRQQGVDVSDMPEWGGNPRLIS